MSFSNGFYAGMSLGDRIKDNLGRQKREEAANAAAAEKENLAFAGMTPEQRRIYLEGQNFAENSPEADLRAKRQRMLEAELDANRDAKTAEIANGLQLEAAVKAVRQERAAEELRERFSKMTPQQQADFHAQEQAPVGIGVLRPEARTPEMQGFVARGQVAQAGLQRETEADQKQRLDQVMAQFVQGRRGGAEAKQPPKPTSTVQYGPDGSVQRRWVRGVDPAETGPAVAAVPQPAAGGAVAGGVPEIGSQEEFDRLPAGAPFVFRGQRGVKKQ